MRRLLLSIILCSWTNFALAFPPGFIGAVATGWDGGEGDEQFSCSCSDGVTFCWEVTANNSNIVLSGGCSVGDTTATMNNSVIEVPPVGGGYAISNPTAYDGPQFSISSSDLVNIAEGTFQFDIFFPSAITWSRNVINIFYGTPYTTNKLAVSTGSTGEVGLTYQAQGSVQVSAMTTGAGITTGMWYTVTAKWRQGTTNPSLSISVNGLHTGTSDTDLTPTTFTTPQNLLNLGDISGAFTPTYLRRVKIWNEWK